MLRDLVHLINVFGLLSLTAVGGGMVTLPQMEHECVQKFHWLTPEQFASAYSLGQLAPGSNMGMVSLLSLIHI
ncbi:MAG: chromate transporter, partial [Terrimicrobiaceae bacterium]|nr:chromate transporter [Terrimicrobiaceae bacterium]